MEAPQQRTIKADESGKKIPALFSAVPRLPRLYVGGKDPNTHLAENRLSSDFCDWSEVTDGLRWETGATETETGLETGRISVSVQKEKHSEMDGSATVPE